jgi:hypothetical protein
MVPELWRVNPHTGKISIEFFMDAIITAGKELSLKPATVPFVVLQTIFCSLSHV